MRFAMLQAIVAIFLTTGLVAGLGAHLRAGRALLLTGGLVGAGFVTLLALVAGTIFAASGLIGAGLVSPGASGAGLVRLRASGASGASGSGSNDRSDGRGTLRFEGNDFDRGHGMLFACGKQFALDRDFLADHLGDLVEGGLVAGGKQTEHFTADAKNDGFLMDPARKNRSSLFKTDNAGLFDHISSENRTYASDDHHERETKDYQGLLHVDSLKWC